MLLAALSTLALVVAPDPIHQDPPAPQEATVLDEVVVRGSLQDRVEAFVEEIAAPPEGRFLASWRDRVCPGVVNLQNPAAQAVLDRISGVAAELGVQTGAPGCDPNVVIIFTDDGSGLATALVEQDRRVFDRKSTGALNRDEGALTLFMTSDAPVRWWHLSVPMDPVSKRRVLILPDDLVPSSNVGAEGRLSASMVDVLYKVIVIVDADRLADVRLPQLADYLAMVALAQIDPEAEVGEHHTILNVFERPGIAAGLTDWDRSYLQALYASVSRRRNPDSRTDDVSRLMVQDQSRPEETEPEGE